MPGEDPKSKRRYPRVETPVGLWVAWQSGFGKSMSRVRDLNLGGLFVVDANTAPVGSFVSVLFSVREGEIRCDAVVRNVKVGTGMGLEFINLSDQTRERLQALISRLLQATPGAVA
jgi:hypothetical protein